jgi:alpha-mannosidase
MIYWSCPGDTKAGYDEAIKQLERISATLDQESRDGSESEGVLEMGYEFGPSWTNHWIKAVITIPEELRNVDQQVICTSQLTFYTIRLWERVADDIVEFDPSCEALIFSSDGVPQHGMSPTPAPSLISPGIVKCN